MQTPVSWDAEARRLRAQGHDASEIAARLDKAPEAIRGALRGIAVRRRRLFLARGGRRSSRRTSRA